ncbi:hydrogenase maturation nickel metallochaperone HypA [candidate division FCPU426 bacterium]|nr:hydrogenase maturation nickel metallochaperone HypA [candidate division FCPU426 bacterium]
MHEFSLCQGLVESILEEMSRLQPPPRRLLAARVVIGRLRQVVPDYMQWAYAVLVKDTAAAGSELLVRTTPVRAKCPDCGWEGELALTFFACPVCSSAGIEIVNGLELYLENLEIEVEDEKGN